MPITQESGKDAALVHDEWICVGRAPFRATPSARRLALATHRVVARALPGRVLRDGWVRYHVHLGDAPPAPPDVSLTRLTDDIVRRMRQHVDRDANQLKSGLRFWNHGLRHAYVWMQGDEPLCVQWLLTPSDEPLIRSLPGWSGMYPPLTPGCGQVENLYTFSTARRKGVATQFEHALFQFARRLGLRHLVTHVHEHNAAARGWAGRTGWRAFGHITRIYLDVPGMRSRSVFVHDAVDDAAAPLRGEAQCDSVRETDANASRMVLSRNAPEVVSAPNAQLQSR